MRKYNIYCIDTVNLCDDNFVKKKFKVSNIASNVFKKLLKNLILENKYCLQISMYNIENTEINIRYAEKNIGRSSNV